MRCLWTVSLGQLRALKEQKVIGVSHFWAMDEKKRQENVRYEKSCPDKASCVLPNFGRKVNQKWMMTMVAEYLPNIVFAIKIHSVQF